MVSNNSEIKTVSRPTCHVCGTQGHILHEGLTDVIYSVQGEWTLRRCANTRCSLVWLDPMPAEYELPRLYSQYYTHEALTHNSSSPVQTILEKAKTAHWAGKYGYPLETDFVGSTLRLLGYLLPTYQAQWDFSVYYLDAQPGGRLLEIGCGDGITLRRMSALGWQSEGIDFDLKAVEIARKRGLRVFAGTLDERNFAPNSFDAIVMSHVIEHVPDPRALLESCSRILKPGGHLVSITPNASSWGHQKFGRFWRGLEPPRHLHIFTLDSMKLLAETTGFSRCEVSSVIANAHGIFWASRRLKHGKDARPYNYSTIADKARSRATQLVEWILLQIYTGSGEEIRLIAAK